MDDHSQMRMHEEDGEDEERREGHVEEGDQGAGGEKAAQFLQVAQGLILSPVVMEKPAGTGGGATRPDPPPTTPYPSTSFAFVKTLGSQGIAETLPLWFSHLFSPE